MIGARRGAMLLEAMVATALLAVTVSLCLTAVTVIGRQQLALDRRGFAVEVANNLLERLSGHDWSAITPSMAAQIELPTDAAQRLPAAELDIQITPCESPEAKRITLTVRWHDKTGRPSRPVRLTTWVYRIGGPRP